MYLLFVSSVLLCIFFNINGVYCVTKYGRCTPPSCYKSSSPLQGVCPSAYTPFKDNGDVNYSIISKYVKYLSNAGIKCIFVSTDDTGSFTLGLSERIKLVRAYVNTCRKYDITVIPEVGGQALMDALEMAKEVSEMGVPAIVTLPELYYLSNSTEMNVKHMCAIGRAAKTSKVFYYDNPVRTGLSQNVAKLWVEAIKCCPDQFAGVITTLAPGLDILATNMVSSDQSIFIVRWEYSDSAYAYCLNGTADVITNVFPKASIKIEKDVRAGFYKRATDRQLSYNRILRKIFSAVNVDILEANTYQYVYSAIRYATSVMSRLNLGFPSKYAVTPLTARQKKLIRLALHKVDRTIRV